MFERVKYNLVNYRKSFSLFGAIILLGLSVLLYENIEISFSQLVGNADRKIVIPSATIDLNEGKSTLLVNTIVNDKSNVDDSIVFDHSNVRIKVIAGNPNPETFITREDVPETVILDPGNYDIQVFLEFDFDKDGVITAVDITKLEDLVVDNEGNSLLELNNCKGNIVEEQRKVCTVQVTNSEIYQVKISDEALVSVIEGELQGKSLEVGNTYHLDAEIQVGNNTVKTK